VIGSEQFFDVLGIRVKATQIPDLIADMESVIQTRQLAKPFVFANVHVIMEAQHDPEFKTLLNDSVVVPDGKPLTWIGRKRGFDLPRRVYGPDLMIDFFRSTKDKGYRHFFYGGAPGVAEELGRVTTKDYGAEVVGVYAPPFRPLTVQEDAQVVRMINDSQADVLWVGLGCPKQEKWAYSHRGQLRVPVINSVGQAFDIHSGSIKQAPLWMRENGLEWIYRLISEPRRLWKRYLVFNAGFILRCLLIGDQPFSPLQSRQPTVNPIQLGDQ
jgi:N-acetylglucosaminyldiphosphoundecaprenol N-acetyl-beta-D-mannosaminyltransferase